MRKTGIGMLAFGLAVGAGCDLASQLLSLLSDIELLGVVPAAGFADPTSAEYGQVRFAVLGRDDLGAVLAPALGDIEVSSDDGQDVEATDGEVVEGHGAGSLVLLVDGSGSTESDLTCDGCPTDPARLRVEAAKELATELEECGGGWRMSLLEFGGGTSHGLEDTAVLADWTTASSDVVTAADALGSYATTPLWDATYASLGFLADDAAQGLDDASDSGSGPYGVVLVVISDGADNESSRDVAAAVAQAIALGIPVHALGFGPASDSVDNPEPTAVAGLQQLAGETGGTYGYVASVTDLPVLTEAIAAAACGGYTAVDAVFSEPPASGERVTGELHLAAAPQIRVPFVFRAP